jgi:hypothetical protein
VVVEVEVGNRAATRSLRWQRGKPTGQSTVVQVLFVPTPGTLIPEEVSHSAFNAQRAPMQPVPLGAWWPIRGRDLPDGGGWFLLL